MSETVQMYCPAGPLVTKDKSPCCITCGRSLWHPVYPPTRHDKWTMYNAKGHRLGFVKTHRKTDKGPVCWNGKTCGSRKAVTKP